MNKHDAIAILEEVKMFDDSMYQYNSEYMDALNMAIEALQTIDAEPVKQPAEYKCKYEVILAATWMDRINVVVECDSIYSCVVKGSQLCDMVNKMGSHKYEIAEITLLEDD